MRDFIKIYQFQLFCSMSEKSDCLTDGALINYPDTTKLKSVKKYGFINYFHLVSCFPYFAGFYFDKHMIYATYYKIFQWIFDGCEVILF